MKVGDKIPVLVAGEQIAEAEIKEVGEGTVTFIVPARRVVMATKTEVDPTVGPTSDGAQVIIEDAARTPAQVREEAGIAPLTPETNASAPVVETQSSDASDASKVITSTSVPTTNPGDPQNQGVAQAMTDPKVAAQIAEIVAAHLAATGQTSEDS